MPRHPTPPPGPPPGNPDFPTSPDGADVPSFEPTETAGGVVSTILPYDPVTNPDGGGPGPVYPALPPPQPPFFYIQLLPPIPAPNGSSYFTSTPIVSSPRVIIEHAIMDLRAPAQRADLADGRRVYRLSKQFLWTMNKDQIGYYVYAGVNKAPTKYGTPMMERLYWSPVNPITGNDTIVRDWVRIE